MESKVNFDARLKASLYLHSSDPNLNYIETDIVKTKFIYPMHEMADIIYFEKEMNFNMDGVRKRPRKGIFNMKTAGFKAFNNPNQTPHGINGMLEFERDDYCKDRYIFVTLTSLSSSQSLDLTMKTENFSKYPMVRTVKGSASLLQVSLVGLVVCLLNLQIQ